MSMDLQEGQRGAIIRMLQLKSGSSTDDGKIDMVPQWKVLIYDRACQDIIAPILKVGQLRSHGVTLHLALKSERHPVLDVPVIYFVEPTEESIARIVSDYRAGLYSYMHINFSSSISTPLLKRLANDISSVSSPSNTQISKVIDRYCSFVSLDQTTFSLNLNSTYLNLHQSSTTEQDIESIVQRVALGLLSVVLTSLKQVPVIRAPQNEAAGMAAQMLNDKLVELVNSAGASDLFSSTASVSADPSHAQRPLLVILDRDMDLTPMVGHGWSYQSLMTDLLGMNLNRLSIPKENKHYDIDPAESFWKKSAHLPFPDAATSVNELVSEFSRMRGEVTSGESTGLSSAVSALPQITEMKKTVDMHTTIATALLNEIKLRKIDKFVEIENELNLNLFSQVLADLDAGYGGVDKVRTAVYLLLKKEGVAVAKIDQIISQLADVPSANAVKYVKYLLSLRGMLGGQATPPTAQPLPGMLGGIAEKMRTGMKNLKTMLPVNDNLVVTNTVQQLADQVVNPLTDSFMYFDPRNPNSSVRVRGSFRQIIVCVVGGGNITEGENLATWSAKTNRTVLYGATDFPAPTAFIGDLAKLAK